MSPSILAMIDAAAAKYRTQQIKTKGWRGGSERRRVLIELGFWAADVDDLSLEGRRAMLRRMSNGLRAEHKRSQPNSHLHWTYHRSRHVSLLAAHRAETIAVKAMQAEAQYLEAAE